MQTASDNRKKRRRPHLRVTGEVLKLYGCATMLFYTLSVSVIQNGLLHVGSYTPDALRAALASDRSLMLMSSWASLFQLIGGLSIPVFAFLLTEGFQNTRSFPRYLGRMVWFALLSEIPYDYAMTGKAFDLSGQNALITLCLCLVMLYGLRLLETKKGAAGRLMQAAVVLAAALWCSLLRCAFGLCSVLLCAVYYLLRERNGARILIGCAISLLYVTGPISGYALWSYSGERGDRIPPIAFYLFYPLHLLVCGLLAAAIA